MPDSPIFTREYKVYGSKDTVFIEIYEPQQSDSEWACECQLTAPMTIFQYRETTLANDKLEAMCLMLQWLPSFLDNCANDLAAELSWMGDRRLPVL